MHPVDMTHTNPMGQTMKLEQILIGDSQAVSKLRKDLPKIAAKRESVIIIGEPGTGKATIARIIHGLSSPRCELVEINPHGISDAALCDALEGLKDPAILFLPDLGEFSFLQQSMLATAAGGRNGKRGLRIIATASGDPSGMVAARKLLPELGKTVDRWLHIELPPLSRRVEDIPLLVDAFIRNACVATNTGAKAIDMTTVDFLKRRTWKGNVRELKSVVEKAAMESPGDRVELPTSLIDESAQLSGIIAHIREKKRFSFDKSLLNLEKTLIERTLELVSFNQSHAADILNLSEANLRYRMKKFKIKG
jgi:DNA-binding NtrC family response regulator